MVQEILRRVHTYMHVCICSLLTHTSYLCVHSPQYVCTEYDALSRLGIDDPQEYISRRYGSKDIVQLSTCCVGRSVVTRVEGALEEVVGSGEWVDVMVSMISFSCIHNSMTHLSSLSAPPPHPLYSLWCGAAPAPHEQCTARPADVWQCSNHQNFLAHLLWPLQSADQRESTIGRKGRCLAPT